MATANVGAWSATAASNATVGAINWAENQAASTVNDSARALMADIRAWYNDAQWIEYGDGDGAYTATYVASTQFKFSGVNLTSVYHVGRRVKLIAPTPGTIYGTISVSAFSTDTTLTITWDSGSLSNESITNVYVGIISATNSSAPAQTSLSVSSTGAGIVGTLTSTDAGASEGPDLDLYRDSASPAANDVIGAVQFNGRDSAANKQTYGRIKTTITTATSGSEASTVTLSAFAAGAETDALAVGGSGVLFNSAGAFRGEISGLTLSNNGSDATNDIDIAVGSAAADATPWGLMALTGALTKQLDASWAVGTNAGMRATGAAIANGTYHIFLIRRPDTGVVDIAADTSATGANITANTASAYTQFRRIGSILRESAAIVAFVQSGDLFLRKSPLLDITAATPGSSAVTRTLLVPTGIVVEALLNVSLSATTNDFVYLSALSQTDLAASNTAAPLAQGGIAGAGVTSLHGGLRVLTNTSAQIRSRMISGAGGTLYISSQGWIDRRGRDD